MSQEATPYTVDYFIKKFTAIPDEKWCVGHYINFDGQCCAKGLCGDREDINSPPEASALEGCFPAHISVCDVNDGELAEYQQATPRARILAALNDIKNDTVPTTVTRMP